MESVAIAWDRLTAGSLHISWDVAVFVTFFAIVSGILVFLIVWPCVVHLDKQTMRMWDEARFAVHAMEMARNGNWLVQHFDGSPDMWSTKPPLATWLQVRMGLSPLDRVRRGVAAVRSGKSSRLAELCLDEVQPLVDEINELLETRDVMIERARAWTADLAHGLKTPLSALGAVMTVVGWFRSRRGPDRELIYSRTLNDGEAITIKLLRGDTVVAQRDVEG